MPDGDRRDLGRAVKARTHRPDMVTRTGVIQPFPIQEGPAEVAYATIKSFNVVRPGGPLLAGLGYEIP